MSEGNDDINPMTNSHWTDAMNKEMEALLRNDTWDLVDLPKDRKAICSCNQREGINYEETFSPVIKITTVRCLLNIVVLNDWPMFQLDIDNAFLYGDLNESDNGIFLALLVYVDDIIITGNDTSEIEKFKEFLRTKFMIKDLGNLKYFLRIEVINTDKGICLNQRKYVLDLLTDYGMLACKPARTPMLSKVSISNEATSIDPLLDNIVDYQKLMGKLIYLTNTRPDISYVVHCLSQFMHAPLKSHLRSAFKILRYLKGSPGLGIHITKASGMYLKAYSDADWAKCVAEYKALASVTSEVIWVLKVLKDLGYDNLLPVSLFCDSKPTIKIAANPVFHERTKHLEIDLQFGNFHMDKYRVSELRAIARERKIKGCTKYRKSELAQMLGIDLIEGNGKQKTGEASTPPKIPLLSKGKRKQNRRWTLKPRLPKVMTRSSSKSKNQIDWLDFPSDVMVIILSRIAVAEILWNVQIVCTKWHEICKDPYMWRVIYMDEDFYSNHKPYTWPSCLPDSAQSSEAARQMCKTVVERSQGQLVDITIVQCCDDELLEYVVDRSSQLRRLTIGSSYDAISDEGFTKALKKLPLLKLNSTHDTPDRELPEVIVQNLPQLRHLELWPIL
ncbi:ribonuclease H-like domain-containing protein [Tanacetum coccineum]